MFFGCLVQRGATLAAVLHGDGDLDVTTGAGRTFHLGAPKQAAPPLMGGGSASGTPSRNMIRGYLSPSARQPNKSPSSDSIEFPYIATACHRRKPRSFQDGDFLVWLEPEARGTRRRRRSK